MSQFPTKNPEIVLLRFVCQPSYICVLKCEVKKNVYNIPLKTSQGKNCSALASTSSGDNSCSRGGVGWLLAGAFLVAVGFFAVFNIEILKFTYLI